MKIFVTGATGYIGGSIAEKLLAAGHEVTGLVRSDGKAPLLTARGIEPVAGTLDVLIFLRTPPRRPTSSFMPQAQTIRARSWRLSLRSNAAEKL